MTPLRIPLLPRERSRLRKSDKIQPRKEHLFLLGEIAATMTLLANAVLAAPRSATAAGDTGKYRELLDREGAGSVVRAILVAYGSETAATELEQLGNTLAASSAHAIAVLDALSAERSVEAAT